MSAPLPAPDHATVARRHALAHWVGRGSLAIVVVLGLGAPFLLEPSQALWM